MTGYFESTEREKSTGKITAPEKYLILDGELMEKPKAFQKSKS